MSALHLVPPSDWPVAVAALVAGLGEIIIRADAGTPPSAEAATALLPAGGVVVLTSGSTGQPKAVALSSAALRAGAAATTAWFGGSGRWLTALPTGYVAGLMTLVRGHLGAGWAAVDSDLSDLATVMTGDEPHYLSIVPTQLVRAIEQPTVMAALARCAAVLVGGARLEPAVAQVARDRGVRLVQTYGMSETAGGVVYDGWPLPGVTLACPNGRVEITSPTCFAGYVGDPVATAAVLKGRTFLTSDRGRLVAGRLSISGRIDSIVQSGGVNVDLDQLQRQLDELWGPYQIVAFAVPDSVWGARIMAATTRPLSRDEVVARLASRVDRAAYPRSVMIRPRLPLTASGKPDRQLLVAWWEEERDEPDESA